MASGTINGSFSGPSSTSHARPQITWSSTTNVNGNYSNVTATLRFRKWQYWNSYNLNGHSVTININGNSGSANRVFDLRNSSNYVVWSRTVRVNHNSNGSQSITIRASGNTGVALGSYNFSGTANLGTIPRASSLTAFSFNANLKNGVANRINYTVDRKSGSFRHQIQLRDGGTTIRTWDNISSDGSSSLTLSASEVNTILNRISNTVTKSFTLRIATRNGVNGSWVGSAVSRNATARVHDDVRPSASGMSVSISGNGYDKVIGKYVQGITRVYGSFSGSAGYGASVSNRSFVVRRVSGGSDSQTVNSSSGTTSRAVALSGSYEAIGTIRDSRGRTNTSRTTFTVDAYSAPVITTFSATRNSNAPTTVNIVRAGRHSSLNGSNRLTISVQRKRGSGSWANVVSDVTTTGSTFSDTVNSTGNNVSLSYDFRVYIKDQFGRDAEITASVSTQRVVLDIHKNEGIGIGKVHERGVLDVDGDIYSNGVLYTVGGLGSIEIPAGDDLNNYTANGFYHNRLDSETATIANVPENRAFSLLVQKHTGTQQTFTSYGGPTGTSFAQYIRNYYNGSWGPWVRSSANTLPRPLWEGSLYMHGTQTVAPIKRLSDCNRGWMLQWSAFDGSIGNNNFTYTFIPKQHAEVHSSRGLHQIIGTPNYGYKTKYLYVHETRIEGNQRNAGDGIVLRRVYEW